MNTQDNRPTRRAIWQFECPSAQKPLLLGLNEWCHGTRTGLSLDHIWLHEDDAGRPEFQSLSSLWTELDSEVLARLAEDGRLKRVGDQP